MRFSPALPFYRSCLSLGGGELRIHTHHHTTTILVDIGWRFFSHRDALTTSHLFMDLMLMTPGERHLRVGETVYRVPPETQRRV